MKSSTQKAMPRTSARPTQKRKTSRQNTVAATPRARMLAKLKESLLDEKDARALGMEPCTAEQSTALGLSRTGDGFKIPYFSANGTRLEIFRFRYFDTKVDSGFLKGTELRKYDQPQGTKPEIYLSQLSGTDWQNIKADSSIGIGIVEGELKAASATKYIKPTIGTGGVFNFGSKKLGVDFLPSLEEFTWAGREVHIIFDSDIAENEMVLKACNRLARLLTERGANVRVVIIPPNGKTKVGADDFIYKHGKEAFKELLDKAQPWTCIEALLELDAEIRYVESPSCIAILPCEGHPELELITVRTARDERFANLFFENEDGKKLPAFPEWFKNKRLSVSRIEYAPGEPATTSTGALNKWSGWPFTPKAGDVKLWTALLDYIFKDATPDFRKWVEEWIAWPLQHPGAKMYTALVLWSLARGTGKTLLGKLIAKLYGVHAIELNQATLTGRFNAGYAGRVSFVLGAEILGENSRKESDAMKHLITGHEVIVEQKHLPSYEVRNCMNFLMTSNHPNPVYAGVGERRYATHEIKGDPMPDTFYKPYDKWLNASVENDVWSPAVFHHLLKLDTSAFNPHAAAPRTEALAELIDANRTQVESWTHELRVNPDGLPIDTYSPFRSVLSLHTAEELLAMFGRDRHHTLKSLTLALRAEGFVMACGGEPVRLGVVSESRPRLWIVRDCKRLAAMNSREVAEFYASERRAGSGKAPKFSSERRLVAMNGGKK